MFLLILITLLRSIYCHFFYLFVPHKYWVRNLCIRFWGQKMVNYVSTKWIINFRKKSYSYNPSYSIFWQINFTLNQFDRYVYAGWRGTWNERGLIPLQVVQLCSTAILQIFLKLLRSQVPRFSMLFGLWAQRIYISMWY